MRARELIEYIKDNELEDYEVMIQPPMDNYGEQYNPVPLEDGDIDWEEDKEELYMG